MEVGSWEEIRAAAGVSSVPFFADMCLISGQTSRFKPASFVPSKIYFEQSAFIFWNYVLDKFFSLSSLKGGEGRGEEANGGRPQGPLTPTLSPLGRGEGVATPAFGQLVRCILPVYWRFCRCAALFRSIATFFWVSATVFCVITTLFSPDKRCFAPKQRCGEAAQRCGASAQRCFAPPQRC